MENIELNLTNLIETVIEQGCVKLKNGHEGIPRKIEITPESTIIDVDTEEGHYEVEIDEIESIIFIG